MILIEHGGNHVGGFSGEHYKACSQMLYFLFKVRRGHVIKKINHGMNEKKNKTSSVYRLSTLNTYVIFLINDH